MSTSGGTSTSVTVNVLPPTTSAAPTPTNHQASATDITLVAANAARKGCIVQNVNNGPTPANLFLNYGATAVIPTAFVVMIPPNGYWEMPGPIYTGAIHAIWDAAGTGYAMVTEQ